jgi:hypothetical protein
MSHHGRSSAINSAAAVVRRLQLHSAVQRGLATHRVFLSARALGLIALVAVANGACAQLETSPSPVVTADVVPAAGAPAAVMLTVRVQQRGSEAPIAGATVRSNHDAVAHTDALGLCMLSVTTREETTIDVSAAGYQSMSASAVIGNSERWTFYLESSSG